MRCLKNSTYDIWVSTALFSVTVDCQDLVDRGSASSEESVTKMILRALLTSTRILHFLRQQRVAYPLSIYRRRKRHQSTHQSGQFRPGGRWFTHSVSTRCTLQEPSLRLGPGKPSALIKAGASSVGGDDHFDELLSDEAPKVRVISAKSPS